MINKKSKILFITNISIITMIITIIIIKIIVIMYDNSIKDYKKIRSDKIVHIDDNNIYYSNNIYSFSYDIIWLDSNNLIYKKDNAYYKVNSNNNEVFLFDVGDFNILENSIIYKNNSLFFKTLNKYYNYNLESNFIDEIDEKTYYLVRDEEYSIDSSKIDILELKIHKDTSDIIINKDVLKKNDDFKSLMRYNIYVRIDKYIVFNGKLYLFFYFCNYFDDYRIVFEYDLTTSNIKTFDCFIKKDNLAYKSYFVDETNLWFLNAFDELEK